MDWLPKLMHAQSTTSQMSYLYLENNNKAKQFFADILTYWVLYSNLVPIRYVPAFTTTTA